MDQKLYKEAEAYFFPELEARCKARLDKGSMTYGDESFRSPVEKTFVDVQEELEDVRNWAAIAWAKLEKTKRFLNVFASLQLPPCPAHYVEGRPDNNCEHCWTVYVIRKLVGSRW